MKKNWFLSSCATAMVLVISSPALASPETTTSPTGGALPAGVTQVGGVVVDITGANDSRIVSELAASNLYVGYSNLPDNAPPGTAAGNPLLFGTQTGFDSTVLSALGGGIKSISVRITLFDGDSAPGDFDYNQNTFFVNNVGLGNFSDVATVQTSPDGLTNVNSGTGFGNNILSTGFFSTTDATLLANLYTSLLATNSLAFTLSDLSPNDNYYDFTQGVDGSLINVGLGVTVTPPATGPFNYWDGDAAGNANNSVVDGGDGIWNATKTNWTVSTGTTNGVYSPNPTNAVFEGTPGTVTVDDSLGQIAVTGLAFNVSGYTITGDSIALPGATTISVGDGTANGSAFVATIDSALTGAGSITKTDLGTLVLNGVNTYTGGTEIAGGTLEGSATSFGTGAVAIDSGATLLFNQPVNATFGNTITGAGAVSKTGLTELILTGVNTYSGGSTITQGALRGTTTSFGSGGVNIAGGAGLVLDQPTDATFSNAISGAGNLNKLGAGAVTLGNANTHSGGTFLFEGALIGTATSFGTGGIVTATGTQLIFDQPTDDTLANVISGGGHIYKNGTGTLVLSGVNTYTGGTTVNAGTLEGTTTSFGTGGAAIASGAILLLNQPTDASFGKGISGAGVLGKTGTGTVLLTGVNTYTGGTFITQGALRGDATEFGTGPVAIGGNGALVIDQPTNATFANVVSGTGLFEKLGVGRLTLTSNSSGFTGVLAAVAGTTEVDGNFGNAAVNLSGTLSGIGSVGSITAASGSTISPGTGTGTIGTLTVTGNVHQLAGSTYAVDLTSAGASDLIKAGSATIASGSKLVVNKLDSGRYPLDYRYTVLTAPGGVTGTYTVSGNTHVSLFYDVIADYDPTHVYLDVAETHSFASVAGTPNEIAAAGGADTTALSGPLHTAIGYLQTVPEAQAAFDAISGEIHATARAAAFEDSRFVREAIYSHLDSATDKALWLHGYGSWGHQRGDGNAARYDRDIYGFFLGYDAVNTGQLRIGLIGGYDHSTLRLPARASRYSANDISVGAYAALDSAGFALRAGGNYTFRKLHTHRDVAFTGFSDTDTANYLIGIAQGFGEVGYKIPAGAFTIEPFANAAFVHISNGRVGETGGPAALTMEKDGADTIFTNLGGRVSIDAGSLKLTGSGAWRHAGNSRDVTIPLEFSSGSSVFTIAAPPLAKDVAAVELSAEGKVGARTTISVGYSGQIGKGLEDHGGKVSISYAF